MGIAELRESLSEYATRYDAAVLSAAQAADVVEQASRIEKIGANGRWFRRRILVIRGTGLQPRSTRG